MWENAAKVSKNEAHKQYKNTIEQIIDKLRKTNGKDKDKRTNILNSLENIESSIFEGAYFHYFDKPEITSIAKRAKLRRQRLNMVKEKKKT